MRALIANLPKPAVESFRFVRTAGLWLLDPFDRLRRRFMRAANGDPVPPLWIRRHSGPIRAFERAATEMSNTIKSLGLLRQDDAVLDVGCGCGSMALEFRRLLGPRGTYVGFDVHEPSIRWCRRQLGADVRFRFDLASLNTAWSRGSTDAADYRFPMADGAADLVLAKSIFTHLLERDAAHYLRELRRVLRRGRAAIVTAFLLGDRGAPQFPYGGPDVWWSVRARPEAAVAYRRSRFLHIVAAANLSVEKSIKGFQDVLILT